MTVVDLSPAMLALDREVAVERHLNIRAIEASMENLSMLSAAEFDVVVQPVSTCYVPDIGMVYRQVARVTASGGIYISQHKQPASLQANVLPGAHGYARFEPYYRQGPLPEVAGSQHREPGTLEYLHRWEELLGGLCQRVLSSKTCSSRYMPGPMRNRKLRSSQPVTSRRTCGSRPDASDLRRRPARPRLWTP